MNRKRIFSLLTVLCLLLSQAHILFPAAHGQELCGGTHADHSAQALFCVSDGSGQLLSGSNDTPFAPPPSDSLSCAITAQQVYDAMIALKPQYPEGMRWTDDNFYAWNGGYFSGGYGCAGFAFILSDAAFKNEPARLIKSGITIHDIRVGDILRVDNNSHSVIVLEVYEDHVVVAEGNYNSSIHWGRTLSADTIAKTTDYIMTRYPEHDWSSESCLEPRTCSKCGTHEEASGHRWIEASCTAPKTCARCGISEGTEKGHSWVEATCAKPQTCEICGQTQGSATGQHVFTDDSDNSCNVCGFLRDNGTDAPLPDTQVPFSAFELETLQLVNAQRISQGLLPLTASDAHQQAAGIRAEELKVHYDSTRPDGSSGGSVLSQLGISYSTAVQCYAQGFTDSAALVSALMDSAGSTHLLSPNYGHLGVGESDLYWILLFTDAPAYTAIRVLMPENTVFNSGTAIRDMGLVAILRNENGNCWLPLDDAYCAGYDPNAPGTQTVTVSVLGVTCTFTVTLDGCQHSWTNATCEEPRTCTACGAAEGSALGHTWTDATCDKPKTCSTCGKTDGKALDHKWTDATCEKAKTCSTCGKAEGSALGHNWVDATCDKPKTCSTCGKTEGSALGHNWADATCEKAKTCSTCGKTEGSALGHNWADATCEKAKTCSTCGKTEGIALGHNWTDATCDKPKTCSTCGKTDGKALDHKWTDATCEKAKTCSTCGKTEGSALGHNWADASCEKAKTCSACGKTDGTAAGHKWSAATCDSPRSCSVCGEKDGTPLGHDWTAASCEKAKTCSTCGKTDGMALGHKWTDATCEKPKTCSTCGKTEGSALGHKWADATCEKAKTCSACGKTDGTAAGHKWSAATCDSPRSCSVCGEKDGTPLGHDWTAASCEKAKTCSTCGKTDGMALGHKWTDATCESPKTCSSCGKTDGKALGHKWADATCESPKTCTVCGKTEGTTLKHDFQDGTCSMCGTEDPDAIVWGDATGEGTVDYMDAMMVLRHAVKLITLSEEAQLRCNVDGKGGIDYMDAMLILRHAVKLIDKFPVIAKQ